MKKSKRIKIGLKTPSKIKTVIIPKIKTDEDSHVVFNDRILKLGVDYTLDSECGIVLSEKIKNEINNAKSFRFASAYYYKKEIAK